MIPYSIHNKGNIKELQDFLEDYLEKHDVPTMPGCEIIKENSPELSGLIFFIGLHNAPSITLEQKGWLFWKKTYIDIEGRFEEGIEKILKSALFNYAKTNNYSIEF